MADNNDNLSPFRRGASGHMNAWPDNWRTSEDQTRAQQAEIERARNNPQLPEPLTIGEEKS